MGQQREQTDAVAGTGYIAGWMNHFWLTMCANEKWRQEMGLRYLSHLWEGPRPYWSFWLDGSKGVYELSLLSADENEGYDWVGSFALKYYPHPQETWFKEYSFLERLARGSEIFDATPATGPVCPVHGHDHNRFARLGKTTGAPVHARRDELPEDFYSVALLRTAHKEGTGSVFILKSQSRWRVALQEPGELCNEADETLFHWGENEVDRNVPGEEIASLFLERLLIGWKARHAYPVQKETRLVQPGVAFVSNGSSLVGETDASVDRIITRIELSKCERGMMQLTDSDLAVSGFQEARR